jgi:hypothetical protein
MTWSKAAVLVWVASLAVDWPRLPGGIRLAEALFLPAMAVVLRARGPFLRQSAMDAAVGAYLFGSAVGLIASADRTASLLELVRHTYLAISYGVVALAVVRGFGPVVAAGLIAMGTVPALIGLLFALVFFAIPFHAPAIGEVMTVPYAGDVLRLLAFTASPTMFACALMVSLAFALARYLTRDDSSSLATGALGVMVLALGLTFSHAWAGAAFAVLIVLWPALSGARYARVAGLVIVLGLTVVFNVSLVVSVRNPDLSYAVDSGHATVAGRTFDFAVMSYFRLKQIAWEAFMAQPLTGRGLDRFHELTRAAYEQGRLPHLYREIDPHSALLGRLAETGVLGGITLVTLWTTLLITGARLARSAREWEWFARAGCAAIAGLLLAGVNVDIMNFRFLWAAMGVVRGVAELRASAAAG